jgi:hypothetical protein
VNVSKTELNQNLSSSSENEIQTGGETNTHNLPLFVHIIHLAHKKDTGLNEINI